MYTFIANPNARSGRGILLWKQIEKILQEKEIEYKVLFTKYLHHATRLVHDLTSDSTSHTIVVLGGDGTLNEVIDGIAYLDKVTLGYIPLGSGNDFARGLGLGSMKTVGIICPNIDDIYMAKAVSYLEQNLRILSGFYGILRPFDGVTPYRLEMQAKLSVNGCHNLYEFWKDIIAQSLFSETDTIVNLASKEYSKCIEKYLTPQDRYITVTFCELAGGTYAKMARGEMVRFMAENEIENPVEIQKFDRLGYSFRSDLSSDSEFVFERKAE